MDNKNRQAEELLHSAMVNKYEYVESVNLSDIDIVLSQKNQARCGVVIDKEQAGIYKEAMSNGDIFPPIILYTAKSGKYVILDGNHRIVGAIDSGVTSWSMGAYIVSDISDTQMKTIVYTANSKHGLPTSLEDRVNHAVYMVENYGIGPTAAAKKFGIGVSPIQAKVLANKAKARAASMGIRMPSISPTSLVKVNQIKDDDVFKKIAPISGSMGYSELCDTIGRIVEKKTAREQLIEAEKAIQSIQIAKEKTAGESSWVQYAKGNISAAKSAINRAMSCIPLSVPREVGYDLISKIGELQISISDLKAKL